MSWSDILAIANTAALVLGAFFAAYQLADLRRQRRRESVLALVRSFQSADFMSALRQVNSLPEGADDPRPDRAQRPAGGLALESRARRAAQQ